MPTTFSSFTRRTGLARLVIVIGALLLAACNDNQSLYALTSNGTLLRFETESPGDVTERVTIADDGDANDDLGTLIQIAYRPGTDTLYGITDTSVLVTIDTDTGALTPVDDDDGNDDGEIEPFTTDSLNDPVISFDPVSDQLRVIDASHNLRVSPDDGTLIDEGDDIDFADGDVNEDEEEPVLAGLAYDNSGDGDADRATLYALDSSTDSLVRIGDDDTGDVEEGDSGDVVTLGTLGVSFSGNAGFVVSRDDAMGYAALSAGGDSGLYLVDLGSGTATRVGDIDDGDVSIVSLAVRPDDENDDSL